MAHKIMITGSQGYIGKRLVESLSKQHKLVGIDIVDLPQTGCHYYQLDVRDTRLAEIMLEHNITHVVHLASILQPSKDAVRDFDIDVNGTRNVLEACVKANVQHITVTSSGAAYGYHADNPSWLTEQHPLRGNVEFAYSHHKRLIEELLKNYRYTHPQLKQLVLRPGTVLGKTTNNQITDLFNKPRIIAIKGSDSPFVFIWDEDVLAIILQGVTENREGSFNLAGDGAMGIKEIAKALNKPVIELPAWLLKLSLRVAKLFGMTQYGPEQLNFLRYRPVLCNQALKQQFAYQPQKSSKEVFAFYLTNNIKRHPYD
ncbi:SDR family oxidoreductase [Pseudoalteromonas shioyasakiensis]|uniref:SDR family oxidoreductase n=1 Tax=Pseudoalteromonas shioyasakiensis TaxID=1190813 RepID=UPI002117C4E4|nr:SDR family oxidoreductase [Pseudoalteromonas shioyasakiensis]